MSNYECLTDQLVESSGLESGRLCDWMYSLDEAGMRAMVWEMICFDDTRRSIHLFVRAGIGFTTKYASDSHFCGNEGYIEPSHSSLHLRHSFDLQIGAFRSNLHG